MATMANGRVSPGCDVFASLFSLLYIINFLFGSGQRSKDIVLDSKNLWQRSEGKSDVMCCCLTPTVNS